MRRQLTIGFFLGFLAIALFGCSSDYDSSHATSPNRDQPNMNTRGANSVPDMNAANNGPAATNDADFMTKAAQGGMAEVELGRLAAAKAQNAEVKQFAQKMVDDHTRANNELKALAGEKNFSMPVRLDAKHQAVMER
jgi:putative membrane protein